LLAKQGDIYSVMKVAEKLHPTAVTLLIEMAPRDVPHYSYEEESTIQLNETMDALCRVGEEAATSGRIRDFAMLWPFYERYCRDRYVRYTLQQIAKSCAKENPVESARAAAILERDPPWSDLKYSQYYR
jgi:hypothetical protein